MISEAANESVLQIICSAAAQKLKIDMMPGKSYIILQHIYNFCQQACKREFVVSTSITKNYFIFQKPLTLFVTMQ